MPIIDVHVHTDVGKSLADFAEQIEIAEQFDAVLVTYAIRPVADASRYVFPTPEFCQRSNDETYALMQRYPERVRGFCYVNPYHADAAAAELERRLMTQGFVGLKLWHALPCYDPRVDRLLEICAHYRVPALQHTWIKANGQKTGESPPAMVAEMAKRHPRTTIIAAHAGGDYEYGAKVFRSCENVLLDIGGNECNAGYVGILVDHVGADRVIFGTDMPGRSFPSQLAKVLGTDLSADDKGKILYKNMARVLAETKTIENPSVFAAQC
jgi:predicted TIM-barrel fold metal-dependent hydrolase